MTTLFLLTYYTETSVNSAIMDEQNLITQFDELNHEKNLEEGNDMPVPAFTCFGFIHFDEDNKTSHHISFDTPMTLLVNPADPNVYIDQISAMLEIKDQKISELKDHENTNTQLESDLQSSGNSLSHS